VGFDSNGPQLWQTDPAGTYAAWKANAIGRSSKTVREFLEKNYTEEKAADKKETVKLAIRALLEVVQSGVKSIELAEMTPDGGMRYIPTEEVEAHMKEIDEEREAEAKEKKGKGGEGGAKE
jgi:20S proteasome subunit alpha 4